MVAQGSGYSDWINISSGELEEHEVHEIQANLLTDVAQKYAEQFMLNTRDSFAKVALTGLLSNANYFPSLEGNIFIRAYSIADGMMIERNKKL